MLSSKKPLGNSRLSIVNIVLSPISLYMRKGSLLNILLKVNYRTKNPLLNLLYTFYYLLCSL